MRRRITNLFTLLLVGCTVGAFPLVWWTTYHKLIDLGLPETTVQQLGHGHTALHHGGTQVTAGFITVGFVLVCIGIIIFVHDTMLRKR